MNLRANDGTASGQPARRRARVRGVPLAAIVCASSLVTPVFAATVLYDNTGNPANTYYMGQSGSEALDDLHLVSAGALDSLTFECYEPAAGASFSATVRIYGNPNGLDASIAPLAGPYVVGGLTSGRNRVSTRLTGAPVAGADIWVGVRFSSTTAGLIINSTPSVGSSHDLYLENGDLFWFNGNPRANFGLRLVRGSGSVGVEDDSPAGRVALTSARPNPFRTGSTISYSIGRAGRVRLNVHDLSGRRVCTLTDGILAVGDHTARWTGRDDAGRVLAAGVYFVRLESAKTVVTRRVVFAP
jgi:hypothetical protein